MRTILIAIFLSFQSFHLIASSINASSFGWNGVDDTQALEDAFHAGYDTLVIDLQAGNWVSGPLIFHLDDGSDIHNLTVIFERGVVLSAKTGAYGSNPYDGLLNFFGCSNIHLHGYEATLQMNKQEYIDLNDGSQWRHGISISGCENMTVYGLEILDTGGDGIEVAGIFMQPIPSKNVTIRDCRIDNAYRNGISVTSCEGCLIEHCEIVNTIGVNPQFGIDLEPNKWFEMSKDISIKNCRLVNNERGGIKLEYWKMGPSSDPFSVDISDCYISDSYYGFDIGMWSDSLVYGHIDIERCMVENIEIEGIDAHKRNTASFTIKDCIFRNVAQEDFDQHGQSVYPFRIVGIGAYPGVDNWVGNFTFENVFLDQQEVEDFLVVVHWGQALGVENIDVDVTVFNPNSSTYYLEGTQNNVTIDVTDLTTLPSIEVGISTTNDTAYETGSDSLASFKISRDAGSLDFPIGVFYQDSGTAEGRNDYHYIPQLLVIPADSSERTYAIEAITDELSESTEAFDIDLQSDTYYSWLQSNVQLFIGEAQMPLPVIFSSQLEAEKLGDKIKLQWETASEFNLKHFLVQRSQNSVDWEIIDLVKSQNSSNEEYFYQIFDPNPPPENLYYRLKLINLDGTFSYSNIASVLMEKSLIHFYPNPSNGQVKISLPQAINDFLIIRDLNGKRQFEQKIAGSSAILDLGHLPKGFYFISIKNLGNFYSEKLILGN